MTATRLHLTDAIYVEMHPDHYVVSWPGGHCPRCADVLEMLGAVSLAIKDTYHPQPVMRYNKRVIPPRPPDDECLAEPA